MEPSTKNSTLLRIGRNDCRLKQRFSSARAPSSWIAGKSERRRPLPTMAPPTPVIRSTLASLRRTSTIQSIAVEYDANATTVLRRTHTDYLQTAAYLDRWIIGLPVAQYMCDGAEGEASCGDASGSSLVSKKTLQYDEAGSVEYQGSPVQHDTDYDSLSLAGRANLSSINRYDVTNLSQSVSSSMVYNTTGSLVRSKHLHQAGIWHESSMSYTDAFSADGVNPTSSVLTLAYPTTITDADAYSSSIKYHYDSGAKTRLQGPLGAIQIFSYDDAARLSRVTTDNNGAYTRYVYGSYYVQSFASINSVADDSYAIQTFDGAGRVLGEAANHPGSVGTYKAQMSYYDRSEERRVG